ncbi:MAG TPA: hypothetical protein VNO21_07695 [Polyangiaceae bacterium]|nr:hypothetical protein [Polyangiaceae bacterium]
MKSQVTFILMIALACSASNARATPRQLPFTYPNETLPEGNLEVELYTDVSPLRVAADSTDPAKGNIWAPEYKLQTEIEYGLTDRFELGFYQVFDAAPQPGGDSPLIFDGLKWRVRTRLAEPGELPVDIGLYLELETMHDEVALEEKINLQRRFAHVRLMANLWVEETLSRPFDTVAQGRKGHFIVNPTAGFVFEATPTFQPGVEYWARGEIVPTGDGDQAHENARVHHFVGPTVHLNFGKLWWSLGAYVHLNDTNTPNPGDAYGPLWFRSVLGLEL